MLLVSCGYKPAVESKPTTYTIEGHFDAIEIVVIDGCQYLYGPWSSSAVLTHKGNCNNPIHPEHTRQ